MNLLIEDAPTRLLNRPINTDFRAMVMLELLIRDPEYSAQDKVTMGLNLLFTDGIGKASESDAWDALLWFYGGGEEEAQPAQETRPQSPAGASPRIRRVYDFKQDANRIYAAFRQVYGVDLQKEALHWWAFRAMLFALPDSCLQGRIMAYRATDASKLKGAEKKRIQQLQRQYAIQEETTAEAMSATQRENQMLQAAQKRFEEAKAWLEKQKSGSR